MDDSYSEGFDELCVQVCQAQVTKHSILNANRAEVNQQEHQPQNLTTCEYSDLDHFHPALLFTLY